MKDQGEHIIFLVKAKQILITNLKHKIKMT